MKRVLSQKCSPVFPFNLIYVCVDIFYMQNMKVSKPLMETGASQENTSFKAFFPPLDLQDLMTKM